MTVFNFELLNVPFAVNAISSEVAPFPDYQRGLGIAFDQTDGKPEMKGLNGLFQSITTSILYLKQRGIAEWDSTLEYVANSSWVMQNGKLYKAIRNNTNKSPALSQLDWAVWASVSDISVSTNGNLKKTVATDGSGSITLEVPTASDSQRGAMRFATPTEIANASNVSAAVKPSDVITIAQNTNLGVGQSYTVFFDNSSKITDGRGVNTTYRNTTGKPILVLISIGAGATFGIFVDGKRILQLVNGSNNTASSSSFIVPNNSTYMLQTNSNLAYFNWSELR